MRVLMWTRSKDGWSSHLRPSWKVHAAANEKIDVCFDSFMEEAVAVRFGMNLACTVGYSKIEVNFDSVEVVAGLIDGYSSSVAYAIFDDCYFMSLDFTHVIYDPCNRERNKVAHELARIHFLLQISGWTPPQV